LGAFIGHRDTQVLFADPDIERNGRIGR